MFTRLHSLHVEFLSCRWLYESTCCDCCPNSNKVWHKIDSLFCNFIKFLYFFNFLSYGGSPLPSIVAFFLFNFLFISTIPFSQRTFWMLWQMTVAIFGPTHELRHLGENLRHVVVWSASWVELWKRVPCRQSWFDLDGKIIQDDRTAYGLKLVLAELKEREREKGPTSHMIEAMHSCRVLHYITRWCRQLKFNRIEKQRCLTYTFCDWLKKPRILWLVEETSNSVLWLVEERASNGLK